MDRRQFLNVVGAGGVACVLPPMPLALPAPLKLYTVCDSDYDPYFFEGWCDAVWSTSEEKALAWAKDNYGGECRMEDTPEVKVLSVWEGDAPRMHYNETLRERRSHVLRQAGWQEESDQKCDCCGLAEFGDKWPLCETCFLCAECAAEPASDCPDCLHERKSR